ncbi:MAG TPA: hypothetical protein PK402_12710, partial [Tepidisphaeraceae bacterium]|nr:hypothetical protein [Tepidisphaeraceae bacterium]
EFPASIQVMVALSELAAVRAITDAVYQNLIDAGGIPGPLSTVNMPDRTQKESWLDRVEVREPDVIQPNPIYEAPKVIRQSPKIIPGETIELASSNTSCPKKKNAIWNEIPPIPPEPRICVIKYDAPKVDAKGSGRWLDLFV